MNEQERRLWSAYDAAIKRIASGKAGASAGLEREYALAYQKLVAAGLALQIKKKYRG
jgi:hypothetical protein